MSTKAVDKPDQKLDNSFHMDINYGRLKTVSDLWEIRERNEAQVNRNWAFMEGM